VRECPSCHCMTTEFNVFTRQEECTRRCCKYVVQEMATVTTEDKLAAIGSIDTPMCVAFLQVRQMEKGESGQWAGVDPLTVDLLAEARHEIADVLNYTGLAVSCGTLTLRRFNEIKEKCYEIWDMLL